MIAFQRILAGWAILSIVILALCAGCAPRGETKNVDQIYQAAKTRFVDADKNGLDSDVKTGVDEMARDLELAVGSRDGMKFSAVSDKMLALIRRAGYPSRPAMGETISELREMGKIEPDVAQSKLLASRVYHVLATEIETTKFKMKVG